MRFRLVCGLSLAAVSVAAQSPTRMGLGFSYGTTAADAPTAGALVTEVLPGGPAAAEGVRVNDVVTAVDGHPLDNGAVLAAYLVNIHGTRRVVLQIVRPGSASAAPMTVAVLFSDAPADSVAPNGVRWRQSMDGKIRNYTPDRSIEVATWQEAMKVVPRDKDQESSIWSIYDHPRDHPSSYVIRESVAGASRVVTSPAAIYANTVADAHAKLPPGSTLLPKDPGNPANLIEVWVAP